MGVVRESETFGRVHRVFEKVVETSNTGRLALVDQLFTSSRHEHRLHIAFCLRQIKELATVRVFAHLDEPLATVVFHVREGARRDIERRIPSAARRLGHFVGQADQLADSATIFCC